MQRARSAEREATRTHGQPPVTRSTSAPDGFTPSAWPDFQRANDEPAQIDCDCDCDHAQQRQQHQQQATVVAIEFSAAASNWSKLYTRAVRLALLNTPSSGGTSAYVHLLDLLRLILKPFSTVPLTLANVTPNYFKQVAHQLIQLADEDIEVQLTRSSTTTIGARSYLLSLAGLRQLLTHPTIRAAVESRASNFGDALETFLHSTLVNSMLVMNHGPQPQPDEPESEAPAKQLVPRQPKVASNPADESTEAVDDNSSGGEYELHCVFGRKGNKYLVHWRKLNGTPWPFPESGSRSVEPRNKIESLFPTFVEEFRTGKKRCATYEHFVRERRREKRAFRLEVAGNVRQSNAPADVIAPSSAPQLLALAAATAFRPSSLPAGVRGLARSTQPVQCTTAGCGQVCSNLSDLAAHKRLAHSPAVTQPSAGAVPSKRAHDQVAAPNVQQRGGMTKRIQLEAPAV